jgi:predicted nucleic acid-binding Zn ribbon protein
LRGSLERLLGTMKAPPLDVLSTIFGEWSTVVGEDLAAHSRPAAVDGARLVVTCDSAAWASEFRWLESQVLERLTEVTSSNRISAITVKVESRR